MEINLINKDPQEAINLIRSEINHEESDASYFSEIDIESDSIVEQLFSKPEFESVIIFIVQQNFCNDYSNYLKQAIMNQRKSIIDELFKLPEEIMKVEDIVKLTFPRDLVEVFKQIHGIFEEKEVDIIKSDYFVFVVENESREIALQFYANKVEFDDFSVVRECFRKLIETKNEIMVNELYNYLKQEGYTFTYKEPLRALFYACLLIDDNNCFDNIFKDLIKT